LIAVRRRAAQRDDERQPRGPDPSGRQDQQGGHGRENESRDAKVGLSVRVFYDLNSPYVYISAHRVAELLQSDVDRCR
jgi:hypothetical protein